MLSLEGSRIILILISFDNALHFTGFLSFVILCFSIYNGNNIWFYRILYIEELPIDKYVKINMLVSRQIKFYFRDLKHLLR